MDEEIRNNEDIYTEKETAADSEALMNEEIMSVFQPVEPEFPKDEEELAKDEEEPAKGEKKTQADTAEPAESAGKEPLTKELPAEEPQDKKKGKQKKKKKKKKVSITNILLVLIMLTGIGILAYPSVSDWWNSMHATQAIAGYVEAVETMSKEEKEAIFAKAKEYNDSLPNGVNFNISEEKYAEYASILDVTGTGIMGYIQIQSIGVNLPVYHGVDEGILQIAVGHIPGSSFPIGGERTHAVMSGHRGLPSAKLFSDLDKLKEGDVFTVTVLDETFTYMIDQIRIVLPEETDELAIVDDKEYATLVTCTPYGVNSHRMLMRGHRIANIDGKATPADAVKIPTYIVIPAVGIPLLFVVLLGMLIYYRKKKPGKTAQETLNDIRKQ
jgi:sortase A